MLILKGFLIGLGKVIPGISGSLIAISMGLYNQIIESTSNLFKNLKKNFLFLSQIFIGIILAIILGSKAISYLLEHFYILTMFTILGFILGTIPKLLAIKKDIKIIIISFLGTFLFNYLPFKMTINLQTTILIGLIEAVSSLVPGISGTAIFINFGVYDDILANIGALNFSFLIPYFLGIGLGTFILVKGLNYLLRKRENIFMNVIIGLVLASITLIFKTLFPCTLREFVFGFIALILATIISYLNN